MPRGDGTGPTGKGGCGGQGMGGTGKGRVGGRGPGAGGEYVCPQCGTKMLHGRGVPCLQQKCPKCGTLMKRA